MSLRLGLTPNADRHKIDLRRGVRKHGNEALNRPPHRKCSGESLSCTHLVGSVHRFPSPTLPQGLPRLTFSLLHAPVFDRQSVPGAPWVRGPHRQRSDERTAWNDHADVCRRSGHPHDVVSDGSELTSLLFRQRGIASSSKWARDFRHGLGDASGPNQCHEADTGGDRRG